MFQTNETSGLYFFYLFGKTIPEKFYSEKLPSENYQSSRRWFLGVDGPLTFKNSAKLPEIVAKIPLERLLLETDCPYLAPVPKRGRRNEPAYVKYIAEKVAEIRNISLEEVANQTTKNAIEVFNL